MSQIPEIIGGYDLNFPLKPVMPSKLDEFRKSFITDLAKPSRFDVTLFIPPLFTNTNSVQKDGLPSTRQLSLRCEAASLPGRTLQTQELSIYGPDEKFPYKTSYEDITLTFICSSSMLEKNLFDLWLEYINPSETWNFRFKNNYATQILINQYDSNVRYTHQIQLVDAFPISVNQLDLNWSDDGYHRLSVTFAYTYWNKTSKYEPEYDPNKDSNLISSGSYQEKLFKTLQAIILARDIAQNIGKSPYAILSAAGAASSIFSGENTLSALLNGTNKNQNRMTDEGSVGLEPYSLFSVHDVGNMEQDK